ncbi:hypothetical protein LZ198_06950 [Myxococcus sp. K15C18031901]|uniref:hypothetical protein n=1 Tax=Myxococcus dinghuensis TaxID=2906761 RepID=UPI0020A6E8C3|nr:hypothetical protein [Myxococcus dinghuensis]MCP3098612.1 hypothetical protein [Myxococcus dinghuensis]
MKTWLTRCLVGGLLAASPALAQDDAPYEYPDDEPARDEQREADDDAYERRRRQVDETDDFRRVSEEEGEEGDFKSLANMDDPNYGFAVELIGGALMLDSSEGNFAKTVAGMGVRATWEYGRTFNLEPLRENLWADLRWTYGSYSDGTDFINTSTGVHYFTIAPAYELKLGKSPFGFYGQLGGGLGYQTSSLMIDADETKVNGMKPVFQYGVGFRGRPRLTNKMSLSFRVEFMGFRRGYLNDMFLGGSLGAAF